MSQDFTPIANFYFASITTAQSATVPASVLAALGAGSKVKVKAFALGSDAIINFDTTAVATITSNVVTAGNVLALAGQLMEYTDKLPTTISVIARTGTVTGLNIQLGV